MIDGIDDVIVIGAAMLLGLFMLGIGSRLRTSNQAHVQFEGSTHELRETLELHQQDHGLARYDFCIFFN